MAKKTQMNEFDTEVAEFMAALESVSPVEVSADDGKGVILEEMASEDNGLIVEAAENFSLENIMADTAENEVSVETQTNVVQDTEQKSHGRKPLFEKRENIVAYLNKFKEGEVITRTMKLQLQNLGYLDYSAEKHNKKDDGSFGRGRPKHIWGITALGLALMESSEKEKEVAQVETESVDTVATE